MAEPASNASPPDASPPEGEPADGGPRSGLRNPQAAVRGVGAGALILEAVVLLLAIQPIRLVGRLPTQGVVAMLVLVVIAVVLAGLLRRQWAWWGGAVLQAAVAAAGIFHWSLIVIGVVFALVWWYVLHVRKTVLG